MKTIKAEDQIETLVLFFRQRNSFCVIVKNKTKTMKNLRLAVTK